MVVTGHKCVWDSRQLFECTMNEESDKMSHPTQHPHSEDHGEVDDNWLQQTINC